MLYSYVSLDSIVLFILVFCSIFTPNPSPSHQSSFISNQAHVQVKQYSIYMSYIPILVKYFDVRDLGVT